MLEIEGTWEEILERADEFAGRRVRLVVLPAHSGSETIANGGESESGKRKSIEELAEDLFADVPREEWEKLPPDLTDQLDHYIYGTPKR